MTDEFVEPFGIPTIYCDYFLDHYVLNGQLHCVGIREQKDQTGEIVKLAEVRLIVNLLGVGPSIARTTRALRQEPPHGLEMAETVGMLS